MNTERKKKYLFGAQAIADEYFDGNRRRVYWLIERGGIPVRKVGMRIIAECTAIEEALSAP